jgi:uncharacterized membrane protein YqjE
MQDTTPPDLAPVAEEHEGLSFAQDLRQLAADGKAFAQAELSFQKSRAAYVGSEIRTIAVLAIVAMVLVFFAVMSLVIGTVIALGPLLGPWGAMGAVTFALLFLSVLGLLSAKTRLKRMVAIVSGNEA